VTSDGGAIDSTTAPLSSSAERALENLEHLDRAMAEKPRRVSRWDRPPPPHDWRWVVGGIGKVLIVTGLLMFAFVAYQLWGTGIEYAQAQSRLDNEFEELITSTVTTTTAAPETTPAPATTVQGRPPSTTVPAPAPLPAFSPGDAIARIEIPSIGLDAVVVAGVDPDELKTGPGHYDGTPLPGQLGNSAIAGHRTTYGQPFYRLDEVAVGDEIVLTTVQGRFVYRATGSEVVEPGASHVVATTDPDVARLTLTTCTPRYTASQRLVVYADLDVDASARSQPAVLEHAGETDDAESGAAASAPPATDSAPPTTVEDPTVAAGGGSATGVSEESADAFSHGWLSDGSAWPQVVIWGLVCTAVAVAAYLLARSLRRVWVGVLVGCVPFLVALYFFYQNLNRLLPAAL
jgi:sortase A